MSVKVWDAQIWYSRESFDRLRVLLYRRGEVSGLQQTMSSILTIKLMHAP